MKALYDKISFMKNGVFKRVFLLFNLLIIISCSKDEQHISSNTLCGIKDPLYNIEWLKELVTKTESSTYELELYKVVWEDQDYILKIPINGSDLGWQLFDCTGNLFCYAGGYTTYTNCDSNLFHLIENHKNMVLIYKHLSD